MRTATRLVLVAFAFVLAAGSAGAQNDVTFQVDLQPFIDACQFDGSGDTPQDSVFVRGTFNDYSKANPLTLDSDGLYTTTISLPEGNVSYKFYTNNEDMLGWEDNVSDGGANENDRDYVVVGGAQEIPSVTFNKTVSNQCGATEETYELTFVVDMTVPIARGDLDVEGGEVVAVAGSFTGWENEAFALEPESDNTNIYTGTLTTELTVPGDQFFKFVIRTPDGSGGFSATEYENPKSDVSTLSNGNRVLSLTGDEPTDSGTGNRFVEYDNDGDPNTFVSYSDVSPSGILSDPATVTFVVDLRPAFYAFADSSRLPGGITDADLLDDVYMNGPLFGESDGVMTDWATWTAEAMSDRQMTYNAQDTTASITLTYPAGALSLLAGKLSIGGADNESGFGGDKFVSIEPGTQTVNLIFGAQVRADGSINDGNDSFDFYDPYILVDNSSSPATATVVRRGGDDFAVANEAGPGREGTLSLGAVYPNPVVGEARVEVSADEVVSVSVYDVTGRRVLSVLDDAFVAGARMVTIDTQGLSSGVYVVRAVSGSDVATRRMTVVR